jgi:hypothetical protein
MVDSMRSSKRLLKRSLFHRNTLPGEFFRVQTPPNKVDEIAWQLTVVAGSKKMTSNVGTLLSFIPCCCRAQMMFDLSSRYFLHHFNAFATSSCLSFANRMFCGAGRFILMQPPGDFYFGMQCFLASFDAHLEFLAMIFIGISFEKKEWFPQDVADYFSHSNCYQFQHWKKRHYPSDRMDNSV